MRASWLLASFRYFGDETATHSRQCTDLLLKSKSKHQNTPFTTPPPCPLPPPNRYRLARKIVCKLFFNYQKPILIYLAVSLLKYTTCYLLQSVKAPVSPRVRARHTPNFATSAAKLVCRASRKGRSTWPELEPRPISNLELGFKAVLNFSPSPKVVILPLDLSVLPHYLS